MSRATTYAAQAATLAQRGIARGSYPNLVESEGATAQANTGLVLLVLSGCAYWNARKGNTPVEDFIDSIPTASNPGGDGQEGNGSDTDDGGGEDNEGGGAEGGGNEDE